MRPSIASPAAVSHVGAKTFCVHAPNSASPPTATRYHLVNRYTQNAGRGHLAARVSILASQAKALSVALGLLLWASSAAAQGTIMPTPHQVFETNAGAPLSNGKICTYAAGTTTPLATYSDEALTVALPNPIRTNSAGRPQNASGTETNVYWSAASYRVDILTAGSDATCSTGTTIYSADNIPAIPALASALDVTGTAGETILAGEAVYLSDGSASCGATAGRWYRTDSDATCSSSTAGMVGVAPAGIASAGSGSIRLQGRITGLSALTAGDLYYASATAGALTATPPTNARFIGEADSTTSIVVGGNPGGVRVPDSDGTHFYAIRSDANLTADRVVTMNFGNVGTGVITHPDVDVVNGRCTLTTAVPVTTADVTAATTLYFTPYKGNRIALYDGSGQWNVLPFTELSLTMVGLTASTPYDIFVDYTAGAPALEAVAWTNATTRATALATQNGVYVQTSDTDSRYVCTIYIDAAGGAVTDSFALRHVWNYYNRVMRGMRVLETTDNWTYATQTFRQANGAAANQLDFVVGVAEVFLQVEVLVMTSGDAIGVSLRVAIGIDSTTTPTTPGFFTSATSAAVSSTPLGVPASYVGTPAVGRHTAVWLEWSQATSTFYGDNGTPTIIQSGIFGWMEM